MDELKRALEWHKQATPSPTIESACVQIGCHYEEVAEMMEPLAEHYYFEDVVNKLASEYKSSDDDHVSHLSIMSDKEKIKLLDALCDQIVTASGVAHSMGFDLIGALSEVNDSNYSKFEDGKPVFNDQGKISKGKNYVKPDLARFVK